MLKKNQLDSYTFRAEPFFLISCLKNELNPSKSSSSWYEVTIDEIR